MPVVETSREQLIGHLHELGISRGMDLVVHARLISFGKLEGGTAGVISALREVVGPEATIAMPAFTLHLREHDVFDPAQTPPRDVGVLADAFARLAGVVRGLCPMHSYAALGPKAEALATADATRSMGPGSSFAKVGELGFTMLLLGCSIHQGATQVHQVEAEIGVPYRDWLMLPRTLVDRRIDVHYYGRRASSGVTLDLASLEAALVAGGLTTRVALPYGVSHRISVAAFHEGASELLRANPYAFVKS